MSTLELKGLEISKIRKTPLTRKYNSETEGFKGKSYSIFSFKDQAFIVHEDDAFLTDFAAGKVYSVELGTTADGLSLLSYATIAQARNLAMAEGEIKYYSSANFKPVAVSANPEMDIA